MIDYNPYSLIGKRVLVTGASSGLGRATAIECSRLGATLCITARNAEELNNTYNMLDGTGHIQILGDLSKTTDIDLLVEQLPDLNGVVCNAGTTKVVMTPFIKEDDLEYVFKVNTFAPIMLTQKLVKKKKIQKNGSIVFVSSISGTYIESIGRTLYSASKSAINGFMRNAAVDLAPKGIRCNCIMPGMVQSKLMQSVKLDEEHEQNDINSYPLKRYGKPEEIAWGVVYLLSDAAAWVTGTCLVVDGGKSL